MVPRSFFCPTLVTKSRKNGSYKDTDGWGWNLETIELQDLERIVTQILKNFVTRLKK